MFSKIFYGAVLGSLVFAASETFAHAETTKVHAQVKRFRFNARTDVTRGQTAPELGFAMDILDMKDWKSLRQKVEKTPFTSLATDGEPPKKTDAGGGS
jgi:hypothetical protein